MLRHYKKIQNVLADVSGLLSALTQICIIFTAVFSKFTFFNTMITKSSLPFTLSNHDVSSLSNVKLIPIESNIRHLNMDSNCKVQKIKHDYKKGDYIVNDKIYDSKNNFNKVSIF